jgi:Flp pilus assembly protein TadG
MKKSLRQPRKLHGRGGVAVEFAVLLPCVILLLAVPLLFGRVFWHYTVAQKAAQDAARFLAAATIMEIRPTGATGSEVPIAAVARSIVQAEIAELDGGVLGRGAAQIDIMCDARTCGGLTVPRKIAVSIQIPIIDPYFGQFTSDFTNSGWFFLEPSAMTSYVGN